MCVNVPDDNCLCAYYEYMVQGVSSYCVVCLDYKCLLSWTESVFYIVCVALWCSILAAFRILGHRSEYVCHSFVLCFCEPYIYGISSMYSDAFLFLCFHIISYTPICMSHT
jgi:hypothetical protein